MVDAPAQQVSDDEVVERLLGAVQSLLDDMGRRLPAGTRLHLDARLDADLGLDSLTRMELLTRIEDAFGRRLAERAVAQAETPRDLLHALKAARHGRDAVSVLEVHDPAVDGSSARAAPADKATLVDALEWHVAEHPGRVHVHMYGDGDRAEPLSYRQLHERAACMAGALAARGISHGDSVAVMLPTGVDYLASFVAILMAGATPVPIYPPARAKQIEEHFHRHAGILINAGTRMLITFEQVRRVSRLLTARVPGLEHLVTPAELADSRPARARPRLTSDHVAFLQYTSGSTGDPKGVVLTHRNILASLRCMRRALEVGPDDVFVSWLPLYHDMGLIGAWLGALVVGFPLVLMSPLAFLARPERWLRAIHQHRGTISGGPNFAFELCHRRISDPQIQGVDLSSWRLAFNGAEPVSPQTMSRFSERFRGHGFDPLAMTPVYGLAEATLGVAFTPVGRGPRVEGIAREVLYARGIAQPARGPDAVQAVSSGVPIPGFEVRIVDDAGREAPDRREGEVEFRGPGVTGGYLRNAEATRALFHDTWARSGDRGYLADGELYITGRNKDVVIRGGRNLYPYALEQAIAEVEGVRRGCVAVFGSADPDGGTERLVVLVETRERDPARRDELRARVASLTHEHLDLAADEVVLAPPHTVLKTSSGKIRRAALAERHARGRLVTRTRAPWLQVLGLAADSVVPTLRRSARRFAAGAYAVWFAMVLAINVLWAWPAVVLVPGTRRSWTIARLASRSVLALAGIRLQVRGEATFDDRRGMLVANHQSYLDGLVLVASLDAPVAFVVKRELRSSRFARPFLDALGVLYVERFERERSVGDARRVADALVRGTRVAFFPEGTFHRMPGLLPFQLGAFEAAVATATAVQPVLIAGTRHVLRGDELFARRGAVTVRFLEPVAVGGIEDGGRWKAAVALREKVREMMLSASAEPDLAMRDALAELTERRREQGGR